MHENARHCVVSVEWERTWPSGVYIFDARLFVDLGHVKLTDMGLAKVTPGKTFTTCGAPSSRSEHHPQMPKGCGSSLRRQKVGETTCSKVVHFGGK
eukprot:5278768-Amphidinium_carterae.1